MQRDPDSRKPYEADCPSGRSQTGFTCGECGRTFVKPILATVSTSGHTQKYYACPRCMTEVHNIKTPERDEEEKRPASTRRPGRLTTEPESIAQCEHFFGYLKKRQKEAPIPEECLTCAQMFECLFHDAKS